MNMATLKNLLQQHRRAAIAVAAGAPVLLTLIAVWLVSGKAGAESRPTFEVQRGPLTISVAQAGTIQAMEQEIITSEVEGQTTIIFLVEEGTRVKQGDLLVQLDASNLQNNLVEQQIRVQNSEAAFIRSRETHSMTQNQIESDISLAERNFRFAQEDLTQYTEGVYKQELRAAESKITLAEEELQLAARKVEWSDKLFSENYISQSERDADRLSHKRANLDLELARAAKKLLEDFTYTRQVAQRESDVVQTRRALERARLKAVADIVQADADLRAKEAEWVQQQGREEKIRKQIAKTKIVASREGLVVYATSAKGGWHGNQAPLDAGQSVRERQELIYLPTAEQMMAVVQVHESNLEKMQIGLPVIVTVDALQGRSFMGKISKIAPLPDATSMWMNPDLKVYRTEIQIEGRQAELRTGMSCTGEIIIERYEDAVYVPVQAVLRISGKPTVYVERKGEFEPMAVEVGMDNNRVIRILSGLKAGETVLLTPPLQEAAATEGRQPGNGAIDPARLKTLIRNANARTAESPKAVGEPAAAEGSEPGGRPALPPDPRGETARRAGGGVRSGGEAGGQRRADR